MDKTEFIRFALTPELKERFKKYCNDKGKDMSKVLENFIKNYLDEDMENNYKWMKEVIDNLTKEKIIGNDGDEIEVIRLSNGKYVKQRDKNTNMIIMIERVN